MCIMIWSMPSLVLFVLVFQFGRALFGPNVSIYSIGFKIKFTYLVLASAPLQGMMFFLQEKNGSFRRQVYLGSSSLSVSSVDVLMVPRDVTASTSGSSQALNTGKGG